MPASSTVAAPAGAATSSAVPTAAMSPRSTIITASSTGGEPSPGISRMPS